MNFDYMTNSQIAALIIGLVFSVIAVGTTFLSIKYAKRFDSFLKAIAITLVAPFIAFAAWLFLIFSFLDGFRNDELLNILISIVIALVICGVIIIIAKALYQKHQAELLETEFEKDREPVPEFEDEQKETLLIEDRKENEEESENEENNVEVQEDTTIENEDADIVENEDVDQQESEEQEETDTENEEPIEDETEENIEPVEDQQDPNAPIVEDYVSETTTPASEENPNVSLAQDEESEDEDDDEDDDDDEDFEKFLESLRKKAEMRKNQNPNTDGEDGDNN